MLKSSNSIHTGVSKDIPTSKWRILTRTTNPSPTTLQLFDDPKATKAKANPTKEQDVVATNTNATMTLAILARDQQVQEKGKALAPPAKGRAKENQNHKIPVIANPRTLARTVVVVTTKLAPATKGLMTKN